MIVVRYAVCSAREAKPVTRLVADTRQEAERALERMRQHDAGGPEDAYWIAELGPECDAWRHLGQPARTGR
jgi:hypothetical protein